MGDLNNIQDEIYAEMQGDLADVSRGFTAKRYVEPEFDPTKPYVPSEVTYTGDGIFGLSFTREDSQIFNIEHGDQKAIVFTRYSEREPLLNDEFDGWRVVHINVLPAGNGWTLQIRRV